MVASDFFSDVILRLYAGVLKTFCIRSETDICVTVVTHLSKYVKKCGGHNGFFPDGHERAQNPYFGACSQKSRETRTRNLHIIFGFS